MAEIIRVKINSDGEVEVKAEGFHGTGCEAIVDALSAGDSIESKRLPEYNEREQTTVRR